MERIDRKYNIHATCTEHGHVHSHDDAVLFLAKDKHLPSVLTYYRHLCADDGADARQLVSLDNLNLRVQHWQMEHHGDVKLADVDDTPEGRAIAAPNV